MSNFKTINYEVNNKTITIYLDDFNNAYLTQKEMCVLFDKKEKQSLII